MFVMFIETEDVRKYLVIPARLDHCYCILPKTFVLTSVDDGHKHSTFASALIPSHLNRNVEKSQIWGQVFLVAFGIRAVVLGLDLVVCGVAVGMACRSPAFWLLIDR